MEGTMVSQMDPLNSVTAASIYSGGDDKSAMKKKSTLNSPSKMKKTGTLMQQREEASK